MKMQYLLMIFDAMVAPCGAPQWGQMHLGSISIISTKVDQIFTMNNTLHMVCVIVVWPIVLWVILIFGLPLIVAKL